MAKHKDEKKSQRKDREKGVFFDSARKVLLAAVGATALAQEEIEDFVDRLIEKGEVAEKDGQKLVRELLEKRKKRAERFEAVVDAGFERFLSAMNIPTKTDISELSKRVAELSRQVEDLTKAQ